MEQDSVRMTVRSRRPHPARTPYPPASPGGAGRTGRRRLLPRARLTGLGCGVLAVVSMLLAAGVDVLLGGRPMVYGALFVLVSFLCATWVRPLDLIAAPISAPIAFTTGLLVVSAGSSGGGVASWLLDLLTALAVNATWLYAGTLAAVAVALVRKVLLAVRSARVRRQARLARSLRRRQPRW